MPRKRRDSALSPVGESHSELSVYERGLVGPHISYEQVVAEAERSWINRTHRHFNAMVLAYVTPWNNKGYEMAKKFRAKLTHVSPVWYQLKRVGTELQLLGRHDADQQWIAEVRKDGHPMILPRFLLEASPVEFLTKKMQRKQVIDLIVSECKNMGFDGVVLEAWSVWTAYGILKDPRLRKMALQFLEELGSMLHTTKVEYRLDGNLELVFVISPPNSNQNDPDMITATDIARLSNHVDGFSLMTYDFSSVYHPGPNAPLDWVHACLHFLLPDTVVKQQVNGKMEIETTDKLAGKILMGINFYGNNYVLPKGGGPILGHEYLSLLRINRPKLHWDNQSMEHYFDYEEHLKKHRVFYPSLESISVRLEVARAWGVGLSIWEIGQGLDYFFDIL
ncbi:hypothetical protein SUGI_0746890 [Cryptomeria japonica]|nr:hypothetical protein SUGI_0746890 [Cryptomeria japonica]